MATKKNSSLDQLAQVLTYWIGTTQSILFHTAFFVGIFILAIVGIDFDKILLILTTAVSLEAIYLSIFIQMSVNRTTKSLVGVEKDIDDIQEDVEDLSEDIIDIQEDVKDISEDYVEGDQEEESVVKTLTDIEMRLTELQQDIAILKKKNLFK